MDIVEFVEKRTDVKLYNCQKELLRNLGKICSGGRSRIVMDRHAGVYIYMDQKSKKELIHRGTTLNRYH